MSQSEASREMPRYRSHKEVWALEIEGLGPLCGSGNINMAFKDEGFANIEFEADDPIFSRYRPVAGDFYVVYADGYKSFSPRKAFLEGYAPEADANSKLLSTTHIAAIAEACHQANKALCAAFGDMSQVDWKDAPQWQRDSAVRGVKFCIENPNAPPSANHDAWLEDKRVAGWTYGPVKDAEAKTHPCFVPYGDLPPDQQAKDHVFKAIVGALA